MERIDVTIVGGGIVGLWCAFEILKKDPQLVVAVFEKDSFWGEHTSTRNSEVLHAGIYYEKNSLKQSSCVAGNILWRDFLKNHPSLLLPIGKYIVSSFNNQDEFENLFNHAMSLGVQGLKRVNSLELEKLKKEINCNDGFFSSTTAVLNSAECIKLLLYNLEKLGCILLLNSEVKVTNSSHDGFKLQVHKNEFHSNHLISASGLFAEKFRLDLNLRNFKNYFVKGNYVNLKKKLDINHLIYPVPPKNSHGLGVHLTINCAGEQKFGPNTELIDRIDYSQKIDVIESMYPAIKNLFPNVEKSDLSLGYSGIRPKITSEDGTLVKDFIFNTPKQHLIPHYYEFLGIESPGFTAAPALAKELVKKLFC
jgi:L-2-hydroxyglutarate oxidase LhgO